MLRAKFRTVLSADPPWMKLLALRCVGYRRDAVGTEVGISMVRASP